MILDGYGLNENPEGNAIAMAANSARVMGWSGAKRLSPIPLTRPREAKVRTALAYHASSGTSRKDMVKGTSFWVKRL